MRKFKLTTQINLVFTIVTVLIGLIFIFIFEFSYEREGQKINFNQLSQYFDKVVDGYLEGEFPSKNYKFHNEYNGRIIYKSGQLIEAEVSSVFRDNQNKSEIVQTITKSVKQKVILSSTPRLSGVIDYKGEKIFFVTALNFLPETTQKTSIDNMIIVITNTAFAESIGGMANTVVRIVFIILIIVGNLIILLWSRTIADRIGKLEQQIKHLGDNNYEKEITISGNDEISDLARTVDEMRQEIRDNEVTKQEMLQNLSHDFKTPIAVIKSYAEAISDGVSDPDDAEVIIKQAEALNQKVHQLLELNKLSYLSNKENFEEVKIKDVLINVVNNHKYQSDVKVFLELDDSILYGIADNYYVIFSNIIDNAFRYAQSKIVITLKNKKITFFNDGEPISQKYIDEGFKPYEKGSKGQFGLGMSIVQETAKHFDLKLSVQNTNDGVLFTLEQSKVPKE